MMNLVQTRVVLVRDKAGDMVLLAPGRQPMFTGGVALARHNVNPVWGSRCTLAPGLVEEILDGAARRREALYAEMEDVDPSFHSWAREAADCEVDFAAGWLADAPGREFAEAWYPLVERTR